MGHNSGALKILQALQEYVVELPEKICRMKSNSGYPPILFREGNRGEPGETPREKKGKSGNEDGAEIDYDYKCPELDTLAVFLATPVVPVSGPVNVRRIL